LGKPSTWPQGWAARDPQGNQYCGRFHSSSCSGPCTRSHKCPVIKPDAYICNADHKADTCPHKR
jgi:hypothetical protein